MSRTPVDDFIKKYRAQKNRLHMPGHKGRGKVERDDVTEIDVADVLYSPHGIIAESQKCASEIFGSAATFYSVEGSSLAIRAAVRLICAYAAEIGKEPKMVAARNVHSTFLSACALCGVDPIWIYSDDGGLIECRFSTERLESLLIESSPVAFYLTSPDYLGNIADIAKVAEICHAHGILLVVDNAHGAYLKFADGKRHPLDLGADICIESAHKTLPCLTGTAYLHVGKTAPKFLTDNALSALSLFASTSPSYLLIASLDRFNGVAEGFLRAVKRTSRTIDEVKKTLVECGYTLIGDEPLKITLDTKPYGYYGYEISRILESGGVFVEFSDRDFVTVMISPSNRKRSVKKFVSILKRIDRKPPIIEKMPIIESGEKVLTVRDAVFSPSQETFLGDAQGKVLARLTLSCPPAVPIAVCGERVTPRVIEALKYYGIEKIETIKDLF